MEKLCFQAATQPTDDDDVEQDEHEFFLNHAILPRYLPAEKQGYSKQLKLMSTMIETIIDTRNMPRKTINLFEQFKRLHIDTTTENFSRELRGQIHSLQSGETFAMFVRRQNCTLLVQKRPNSVVLATFRGDMKNYDVYSHDSDIEVIFDDDIFSISIHLICPVQFEVE